jgi:hypothetical protein
MRISWVKRLEIVEKEAVEIYSSVQDEGFRLTIGACQHLIRLRVSHGEAIAGSCIVRQNEVKLPQKLGRPGLVR